MKKLPHGVAAQVCVYSDTAISGLQVSGIQSFTLAKNTCKIKRKNYNLVNVEALSETMCIYLSLGDFRAFDRERVPRLQVMQAFESRASQP